MEVDTEEKSRIAAGEKTVYILLSQTGTILSRILHLVTRAEYNHASISLQADLSELYAFGRLRPYNPFRGGFVRETPRGGTFGRFPETEALVLALPVTETQYENIKNKLAEMYQNRQNYHYNYLGVVLAGFRISIPRSRYFHCAEFVAALLRSQQVNEIEKLGKVVQPIHFLRLPVKVIYRGKLKAYGLPAARLAEQ